MSRSGMIYQNSVTIDNWQWFWSENCNALYKRNLKTGAVCRVSNYENYKNAAYTKLVYYQKKLIALPYAASKVMIYDMESGEIRYSDIGIPEMKNTDDNTEKFYGAVSKDNWLFMVGCKTAHILKFDMNQELTAGYVDLYQNLPGKKGGIGYLREGVVYKNQIFIPALYENNVFQLDIDNLQYVTKGFNRKGKGFSTICRVGDQIWLFPFDKGEIIQWNIREDMIIGHDVDCLIDFRKGSRNFLSAHLINNCLWIIPRLANKILTYDFAANQFSDKNAVNSYFAGIDRKLEGISDEIIGENILFLSSLIEEVILLDTGKDEIRLISNEMSEQDFLNFLRKKMGKVAVSEKDISLSRFLDFMCGL